MKYSALRYTIIILVLVVACGIYVFKNQQTSSKNIVVLYPDEAPAKISPINAGGVFIPKLDKVFYENLSAKKQISKKINLLPEPEQPINIVSKTKNPSDDDNQIDNIINDILQIEKPNEDSQTFIIDQEIENLNLNLNTSSNFKVTNIINDSGRLASLNRTKSETHYKIQLALTKSEFEAARELEKIKAKQIPILSQHHLYIKQNSFKNGLIVYQVLLGNFDKISRAKQICKKLVMQNQSCFIIK